MRQKSAKTPGRMVFASTMALLLSAAASTILKARETFAATVEITGKPEAAIGCKLIRAFYRILGDADETYDIHGVAPDACAEPLYVSGIG